MNNILILLFKNKKNKNNIRNYYFLFIMNIDYKIFINILI